jgi:3-deoxy-D-manno-octulosonic-acid transferase
MEWLYNLGVRGYGISIRTASLFNEKAKEWVSGRADWREHLKSRVHEFADKRIWFHCASVGEFEQARPVIERLKEHDPSLSIVVTFFSPSGYAMHHDYELADGVFYLPMDTAANARDFVQLLNPTIAVFVKYEFWYHFLKELHESGVPTYLISALFREDQHFFKSYGGWFREPFKWYSTIFVQNRRSYDLLKNVGLSNVTISGDTRLDRVYALSREVASFPLLEEFSHNRKVVIVGSSWDKEDAFIIQFINEIESKDWRFIIAPHEINEKKIKSLIKQTGGQRYSALSKEEAGKADVIVADGYGYLSKIYRYAEIALIGGGFHTGIHSILEPAAFGCALLFGPHNKSFAEASALIKAGGAFEIDSYDAFKNRMNDWMNDTGKLDVARQINLRYVRENAGARELVSKVLLETISAS